MSLAIDRVPTDDVLGNDPRFPGEGGPPRHGGDGDGDPSGDPAPDYFERLRRYRLLVFLIFIGVLLVFTGLTSAYIVRRGTSHWDWTSGSYIRDWRPLTLPPILWVNTLILLVSSVSLEVARRTSVRRVRLAPALSIPGVAEEGSLDWIWLAITLVLGFGFLTGQFVAWNQLRARGIFLASNPSSSFFYILTAAHAVHLLGGIVALSAALALFGRRQWMVRQAIAVDVSSWYWHFMGALWLYLLLLLRFAQ